MYACIYFCMYVCMYVCMYLCMYACMYVCMYVFMCVCMHVRMYVCMYVCLHVCGYFCTYMHACMCLCKYMCIHDIYKYPREHVCTYAYIPTYKMYVYMHIFIRTKCVVASPGWYTHHDQWHQWRGTSWDNTCRPSDFCQLCAPDYTCLFEYIYVQNVRLCSRFEIMYTDMWICMYVYM